MKCLEKLKIGVRNPSSPATTEKLVSNYVSQS